MHPDAAVAQFLEKAGLGTPARIEPLPGGVSSDIWRVDLGKRTVCVKRALPRLRVSALWEAPIERNRYERLWLQTACAASPGAAPHVLAWDDQRGLFAMEYLDLPVWKARLACGSADPRFAARVGEALAAIHAHTADSEEARRRFATDAIFHAIRLEPYLLATARRHPDLAALLASLAQKTAATRRCLVHGDVSPKNILVGSAGPVFLDAECAWYGDPAFDLAFCLNHLFLKTVWVPSSRDDFLACHDSLSAAYLAQVTWESPSAIEARTATLLPGLLLGRIDGKSPVEYLDEAERARVRGIARELLRRKIESLQELRAAWLESST